MAKTRKGVGNTRAWFLEKWGEKYVTAALPPEGGELLGPAEAARDVVELSGDLDRLLEAERARGARAERERIAESNRGEATLPGFEG